MLHLETLETQSCLDFPEGHKPVKYLSGPVGIGHPCADRALSLGQDMGRA